MRSGMTFLIALAMLLLGYALYRGVTHIKRKRARVYLNGVEQKQGKAGDYTTRDGTITWHGLNSVAFLEADSVEVVYEAGPE